MNSLDTSIAVPGGRRLRQGITATWWYTASAVLMFELVGALLVVVTFAPTAADAVAVALLGLGAVVWLAATCVILAAYRERDEAEPLRTRTLVLLAVCAACGVGAWFATDIWVVAFAALAQPLAMLDWPRGVRLRVIIAVTVLLAALWVIDHQRFQGDGGPPFTTLAFFATALPAMTVISLWWWDVLVTLDSARLSEARASAAQERLRVASDVHDLQGHHLQVIALQLELADRLWEKDPMQAHEHIRIARTNVDEARQGTRDLARAFRAIPLSDELANAADLLKAAGIRTEVRLDASADEAPGDVLGPVIRETTTNVLRHGTGSWASLSLARIGSAWRYEISNDHDSNDAESDGSGLDGIARRAAEAGGSALIDRDGARFSVTVTVPAAGGTA